MIGVNAVILERQHGDRVFVNRHVTADRDRLLGAFNNVGNELPRNDNSNCYKYADDCVVTFL